MQFIYGEDLFLLTFYPIIPKIKIVNPDNFTKD